MTLVTDFNVCQLRYTCRSSLRSLSAYTETHGSRTDHLPMVQVKAETLLPPVFGKETTPAVRAVSFHTRQPFLLCRCEEGVLPDEAISQEQKTASAKNASQ